MAQWVKALAARSDERSSTPGTHMVGDNSLPLKGFSFLVLLSNSFSSELCDIGTKVVPKAVLEQMVSR